MKDSCRKKKRAQGPRTRFHLFLPLSPPALLSRKPSEGTHSYLNCDRFPNRRFLLLLEKIIAHSAARSCTWILYSWRSKTSVGLQRLAKRTSSCDQDCAIPSKTLRRRRGLPPPTLRETMYCVSGGASRGDAFFLRFAGREGEGRACRCRRGQLNCHLTDGGKTSDKSEAGWRWEALNWE